MYISAKKKKGGHLFTIIVHYFKLQFNTNINHKSSLFATKIAVFTYQYAHDLTFAQIYL